MEHTWGAPYHPQTQGKIERYHRTMKNVVKLDHYYPPRELKEATSRFMTHYNNERLHEFLDNITPKNAYYGRLRRRFGSEDDHQTEYSLTEEAL